MSSIFLLPAFIQVGVVWMHSAFAEFGYQNIHTRGFPSFARVQLLLMHAMPYTTLCVALCSQVAEHTTNKQKMDEFSMVYYNNLLSLPCIAGLMWFFGEFDGLFSQAALSDAIFQLVAMLSAIVGFAISFSSLWFLSQVRLADVLKFPT